MESRPVRVFSLPTRELLFTYLFISLLLDVLFVLAYGGMNWFNAIRDSHYQWYMDWELSIPLIPGMIYVYLSLVLLFLLPLVTMTRDEVIQLGKQIASAITVSAILFLIFPTVNGFTYNAELTKGNPGFGLVYLLDKPYNLFPSLHISLGGLIIVGIFRKGSWLWKLFLGLWAVLLTLSVVLTHQHHLLDIVGGLLICWFASCAFPFESTLVKPG